MVIGVLQEPAFETRVSLLPESVNMLTKKGIAVLVQNQAGIKAFATDEDYMAAGARLVPAAELADTADIVLTMHLPAILPSIAASKILIGMYQPLYHHDQMLQLAMQSITSFSLDMLPRTTRAQSMDVLSSQANIAGYKAVIAAAHLFPRYFPMFMTAAGSIAPAKVLVLGAGVAGLQAIATARRLGAVVEVFDTRPAVKEEVMSLGGRFIEVEGAADAGGAGGYAVQQSAAFAERQQQKIAASIAKADIVITTAQIPGQPAPVLVNATMIAAMKKGSVIMDLAAATGGNTECTKNNETVQYQGVTIVGNSAWAASMPSDASKLYGRNVLQFLQLILDKEGKLDLNWNDDLVKGCCITHNGALVHEKWNSPSGNAAAPPLPASKDSQQININNKS